MEASAFMFMFISWGFIVSLLVFCFYKLFNDTREKTFIYPGNKKKGREDD